MSGKEKSPQKTRSFSSILLFYMVLLVLCIVGFMAVNNYVYTKNNFERESNLLRVQTEQNIIEAMRLKNNVWNYYDGTLNDQMKKGLVLVLQDYNAAGSDPTRMDFATLKTALGENYDIYVINVSGVIVRTTYTPELGQDFRKIPYFYDYLTKIRNSDGFFADHIVRDKLGAGTLRKFAYMPTPDHRYILELGFASDAFADLTLQLDEQSKIEKIVSVNPYVENFTIYNTMGRQLDNNNLPGESDQGFLNNVIKNRQTLEVQDLKNARITRYLFVDLKLDAYGSDSSRIVKINYSQESIQSALLGQLLFHLVIGFTSIGIGVAIAFVLSQRVTRPIKKIVEDVDIIARGDLEHRIETTHSSEFAILENSTNMMIDSLKEAMKHVKDGEILQREIIDQLPVAVFMKESSSGKYVFWNKASEKIFEIPSIDAIGRTDEEMFSPEIVSSIKKEDSEAFLQHISIQNKKITSKSRGQRILHMIIVPIFDSANTFRYVLGIGEDLTDETLTMKTDLLFSITRRDILDQLLVIINYLERAQLKTSNEAIQVFFNKTLESVESIRNQMAFVSSLQAGGITTPAWQPVTKAFWSAVSLLPTRNIDIRVEMDAIELFADPLLPRIFYNILSNSLQHGDHMMTKIRFHARQEGESLTLIYEDNGTGIPLHEKEKIFEFGYGKGTGFGLFLARELLGYTKMTITETGEPGKGARFEIIVPKGKFRKAPQG
jgi:PAS domain-containing protein/two-component sensor histidine kinase